MPTGRILSEAHTYMEDTVHESYTLTAHYATGPLLPLNCNLMQQRMPRS